jgi:uncharacterized protein DUF1579
MDMPKPSPGHKKLEALAGNWVGEEVMHPSPQDPKGSTATATMNLRVANQGFNVVGDYEQKKKGSTTATFTGHSVFDYDAKTDELILYWFDSMGMGAHPFRGKFDGKQVALMMKDPTMGNLRLSYDLSEKDTLRMKMELSQDGKQWKPMLESVYHRAK